MSKTTETAVKPVDIAETTPDVAEAETTETAVKPYTFRKLGAPDIFLMSQIISKIGVAEFKVCFESDGIKNLIQNAAAEEKETTGDTNIISVGAGVFLEIANVLLKNLPKCEQEIYKMLANTSNLSVEDITAPGNAVMFVEMLIDFVKKDEFKDFIKVVSTLFK